MTAMINSNLGDNVSTVMAALQIIVHNKTVQKWIWLGIHCLVIWFHLLLVVVTIGDMILGSNPDSAANIGGMVVGLPGSFCQGILMRISWLQNTAMQNPTAGPSMILETRVYIAITSGIRLLYGILLCFVAVRIGSEWIGMAHWQYTICVTIVLFHFLGILIIVTKAFFLDRQGEMAYMQGFQYELQRQDDTNDDDDDDEVTLSGNSNVAWKVKKSKYPYNDDDDMETGTSSTTFSIGTDEAL